MIRQKRLSRQELEARVTTADLFKDLFWDVACELVKGGTEDQRIAAILHHVQHMFGTQLFGDESERRSRAQAMVDLAIAEARAVK